MAVRVFFIDLEDIGYYFWNDSLSIYGDFLKNSTKKFEKQ